ncbi:hypothetical protein [Glycomyces sp. NPDC021274]|uniref:hypothetical protein n=1 Tax=Glycomyces sp. NPDC021274 TaxID=3155120 RepID=UPI0033CDD7DD
MSSTTIRYSGVPENSHSRDLSHDSRESPAPLDARGCRDSSDPHGSRDSWEPRPSGGTSVPSGTSGASATSAISGAFSDAPEAVSDLDTDADANTSSGLSIQADGYYDWAGRRLFLLDGSPDPLTPGAYRYQASPDYCDLSAPESDPSSPRYEPPHLRHQPGDTWEIGGKPFDIHDPGPYGNPLWRPDPRTGRHRRGELPDPMPPSGAKQPANSQVEQPVSAGSVPPWGPRPRTAAPSPEPPDDEDEGQGGQPNTSRPITPDRPRPAPRDRSRFWSQADSSQPEHTMNRQRRDHSTHDTDNTAPVPGFAPEPETPLRTRTHAGPAIDSASSSVPFRFDKLREDAWDRFLEKSSDLAAAHRTDRGTALERECGWQIALWVRFFRWLAAVFNRSTKVEPPQQDSVPPPQDQPVLPIQPDLSGQTERNARTRRTELADRSTRFAGAVNGARRARAESSAGPLAEALEAQLIGGRAWA